MKGLIEHVKWLWRTRNCDHSGEVRAIVGDDRTENGMSWRCCTCGKVLR